MDAVCPGRYLSAILRRVLIKEQEFVKRESIGKFKDRNLAQDYMIKSLDAAKVPWIFTHLY